MKSIVFTIERGRVGGRAGERGWEGGREMMLPLRCSQMKMGMISEERHIQILL